MIERVPDTTLEWIKVFSTIYAKNIGNIALCEEKSIFFQAFFYLTFFSRLYTDRAWKGILERGEKSLKFFFFSLEECFSEIRDETWIDRHSLESKFSGDFSIEVSCLDCLFFLPGFFSFCESDTDFDEVPF